MRSKTLNDIVELCGHQAAISLARSFGGRQLIVPLLANVTESHPIALCIGLTGARRLAQARGGERLDIPVEMNAIVELRNEAIVAAFDRKTSVSGISYEFGLSRKTIRNVLQRCDRKAELDARQETRNRSHLSQGGSDD